MKPVRTRLAAWLVLSALGAPAWASDPIGIYALVEKVVLDPNATKPERIQLWGAFSLAKRDPANRNAYEPPERGFLYFQLPAEGADLARAEWSDLEKIAGTGECVGIGSRYLQSKLSRKFKVRRASEKPESPDHYPLGFGLTKMRRSLDYPPIRELISLPAPSSPSDGAEVKPGAVTLAVKNVPGTSARKPRYVFEIERASGEKLVSPPVEPGEKETRWSPALEIRPGEKYIWRVWVTDGEWKGPAASAEFRGKSA